MVNLEQIKSLRERTGVSMAECKKALEDSGGDEEKAINILRERGQAKAAKRLEKETNQGLVGAYVYDNGKVGVILEIQCETDFVARNANFLELVKELASHIAKSNPADEADLLAQPYAGNAERSVQETINDAIAKIGENIKMGRFVRFEADGKGLIEAYIHGNGRVGVLLGVDCGSEKGVESEEIKQLAHDIALHIAAMNPLYLSSEDVPGEVVEAEKSIYLKQVEGEGKPENVVNQIIEGKLKKFYQENCLLEQAFAKDPDLSVQKVIDGVAAKSGESIKIKRFARFQV